MGASAATLRLRSPAMAPHVPAAAFVAPLGPVVPLLAIAMSAAVFAGATRQQLLGGFAALAAGAALFFVHGRRGEEYRRPEDQKVKTGS